MSPLKPLAETLQSETYEQNVRLGTLPFFSAVNARQLPITSYATLLRSLIIVYDAFDQAVAQSPYPVLRTTWDQRLSKSALLRQDYAVFTGMEGPAIPAAALQAEVMAEQIWVRAIHDPLSLLGSAYVLAVWDMGGATLCEQMQKNLHLDSQNGLAFLSSFDAWGREHWLTFAAHLNAAGLDSEAEQRAVQAAHETLDGLDRLFDLLYPLNESAMSEMVALLNPLAGNHKISDDLREIQAAFRAGERTVQLFPYYERRYGQRGRKFTWSDSNWLVTLAGESQASANQQILWLSRLLSIRGMPQWTMECHLVHLYEELARAIPEKSSVYATLYETAKLIREQRHAHLSEDALLDLDREFDLRVGPDWSAWMPHGGGLLAAAVADDRGGITRAVDNIVGWMTDASRFPAHWIEAVEATVSAARQRTH